MRLVEEPLLDAMLQAQHDPDPVRAYRDYPFVLRPAHSAPTADAGRMRLDVRPRMMALDEALARWSRRVRPQATPIAACCA